MNYGFETVIHTPLGCRGKEFATVNRFTTDQKNPPKRTYEEVLPNENNYKDPDVIRFFRTGNYGVEDDDIDDIEDDVESTASGASSGSEIHVSEETIDLSGVKVEEETYVDDGNNEVDTSLPEQDKTDLLEERKKAEKKKRRDKLLRILGWTFVGIVLAGIIALCVKFYTDYRNEKNDEDRLYTAEELIVPFNMAYNYALIDDRDSFLKQAQHLGLDVGSEFGCQINADLIAKYLQNGSIEGFIRRFATIYSYGVKQDNFDVRAANEGVEFIMESYLVQFDQAVVSLMTLPEGAAKDASYFHVKGNADFIVGISMDKYGCYSFCFIGDSAARYDKAVRLYKSAKYEEAQPIFEEIAGYEDADEMLMSCKYYNAVNQYQNKNYALAFSLLADYVEYDKENEEAGQLYAKVTEKLYEQGIDYYNKQKFDESNEIFRLLNDYKDSRKKIHIHNYTETIVMPTSCSHTGLRKLTCSCGKVLTETIPSVGHDYEGHVSIEPTCTSVGSRTLVCKVCGNIHHETIPMIDHTYAPATCTQSEECTVCGQTHGDPLGHNYIDSTICERCGYDYAANIRVVADCLPFDLGNYLWGENHYIVSCTHKVSYNSSSDRMDLVITWTNSDSSAMGYGSLSYDLIASVYDESGKLIKRFKDLYFNKGTAVTSIYGIKDNMTYYVEIELYNGNEKIK